MKDSKEALLKNNIIAAITLGVLLAFSALAVAAQHQPAAAGAASSAQLIDGEVRKVDRDAKKITIKHGPIRSLDMPPMTMVFQAKDPAMLEKVQAGDKVKFAADKVGGAYIVTRIEVAE